MRTPSRCPSCSYPTTKDGKVYRGIYRAGRMCPHCGFYEAAAVAAPPVPKTAEQMKTEAFAVYHAKIFKEAFPNAEHHHDRVDMLMKQMYFNRLSRDSFDAGWEAAQAHHQGDAKKRTG